MPTAAIENIILRDDDDKPVRLGTAWAGRPAVLIWLRHFG